MSTNSDAFIIGVSVGGGVALILVIALSICLVKRCRTHSKPSTTANKKNKSNKNNKSNNHLTTTTTTTTSGSFLEQDLESGQNTQHELTTAERSRLNSLDLLNKSVRNPVYEGDMNGRTSPYSEPPKSPLSLSEVGYSFAVIPPIDSAASPTTTATTAVHTSSTSPTLSSPDPTTGTAATTTTVTIEPLSPIPIVATSDGVTSPVVSPPTSPIMPTRTSNTEFTATTTTNNTNTAVTETPAPDADARAARLQAMKESRAKRKNDEWALVHEALEMIDSLPLDY